MGADDVRELTFMDRTMNTQIYEEMSAKLKLLSFKMQTRGAQFTCIFFFIIYLDRVDRFSFYKLFFNLALGKTIVQ